MTKSYKATLIQFAAMAEQIIKNGASELEDCLCDGDWTLLVINRICLDETELSTDDQNRLKQLDKGIAESFTFRLLVEYAELYPQIIKHWAKKEDEEKHLDRLSEIIFNSVEFSEGDCSEYVTFAQHLIEKRKNKKENKESWEELNKALQACEQKLEENYRKTLNNPFLHIDDPTYLKD